MGVSLSFTGHAGESAVSGRKVYTVLPPPKDYVPASGDGSRSATDAQPVSNTDEMPPGKRPFRVCECNAIHISEPVLHQSLQVV